MKRRKVLALYLAACIGMTMAVPTMTAAKEATETVETEAASDTVIELEGGMIAEAFANPTAEQSTRVRFWIPAAAVEEEVLRANIQELAAMNFGGLEVVCFTSTLEEPLPEEYEWGSDKWLHVLEIIVDEAQNNGMAVDIAGGPGWPLLVDGLDDADDEAACCQMTFASRTVAAGESVVGETIKPEENPKAGTTKLISAAAYRAIGEGVYDFDTYTDLTDCVTLDEENQLNSTLTWTAPDDGDWTIFTFWEQPTALSTGKYTDYVVDHLSKAGSQAIIDYWEGVFAEHPTLTYISNIFCDSMEYKVDREWTRGFLDIFEEKKGYDLTPYLVCAPQSYIWVGNVFSDSELTEQVINDYYDVLNDCYIENHLKPLQEFAEKYDMDIRYQVTYNKPFSVGEASLYVGVPETESLEHAMLDFQRTNAATVHMTDTDILSYETTAEFGNGNRQSYEDIAWWQKRAWAVGVNLQYLHGASYSGEWTEGNLNYTWPGYKSFGGFITNDWNRYTDDEMAGQYISYFSRMNSIMQKNTKVDIAVYNEVFADEAYISKAALGDGEAAYPDDSELNANGYSYDLLSDAHLKLDSAVVTNNILNEDGAGYKALIIHNQEMMAYDSLENIKALAEAGLPVIFVGELPSKEMYYADILQGKDNEALSALVEEVLQIENVIHVEDYADVVPQLEAMGIVPDSQYDVPVDILTSHKTDETGEYYYLYNYNRICGEDANSLAPEAGTAYPYIDKTNLSEKSVIVTLKGEGRPYLMDAWNGTITPIAEYLQNEDGTVTIPLEFEEDQTMVIALLNDEVAEENGLRVEENYVMESDAKVEYDGDSILLKATEEGSYTSMLSDGTTVLSEVEALQAAFDIPSWTLEIDSLGKGETEYFTDSVVTKLKPMEVTELRSWRELSDDLEFVSGVGTYSTTITLDKGWEDGAGAYMDLGEIEDTFNVYVNGEVLPVVDANDTVIDIGKYVHSGENTIEVKVATTIYNAVKGIGGGSEADVNDNGMFGVDGVVTVTPYQTAVVK